jgi:hypothetical protein
LVRSRRLSWLASGEPRWCGVVPPFVSPGSCGMPTSMRCGHALRKRTGRLSWASGGCCSPQRSRWLRHRRSDRSTCAGSARCSCGRARRGRSRTSSRTHSSTGLDRLGRPGGGVVPTRRIHRAPPCHQLSLVEPASFQSSRPDTRRQTKRPEPGVETDSSVACLVRVLIWSLTCPYRWPLLVVDSPHWSASDGPVSALRQLGRPHDG